MKPGPDEIYKCLNCNSYLRKGSLSSGNTIGAKLYSDGYSIAPMLPEFPKITICNNCGHIFWLTKICFVDTVGFGENKYEEADEARFLNIKEYFKALDNKLYSSDDDELFLRLRIWWSFNDRVRSNREIFENEEEKNLWRSNAVRLIEMLHDEDNSDIIMKAELYRNMGEFEKCLNTLNIIKEKDFDWLKSDFEENCKNRNTKVFELRRL